ncbi:MAG: beta-lactamase family protein [Anaerolineales bacterium]|nr:beta-lactamase family protein [Anaerolineales bacterium]
MNILALDDYFQSLAAQDEFSGVVQVTRGDEILFTGAYGYASRAWGVKNTLETRFDTASLTKLFTAVATLQLVELGHISLETRVMDFLGLMDTAISPEVNVYHLLTHTSGIGDDADEEAGELYEDLWKTKPNYAVTQTVDFLPQFIHKPPNFSPGQGCRYCNVGYVLLGLVIERVSGMAYRDYVRERIFVPAGMDRAGFFRMDRVNENVAEGADPLRDEAGRCVGWKRNIYSYPPIGSPDAGAHVTAGDLQKFLRAVQSGQLLFPAQAQAFLTPQVLHSHRDGWDMKYGMGLWFNANPDGEVVYYQKEGINPGTSAILRHYPKTGTTVILLSNLEDGVWAPARKIHEVLLAS